jgi:predicted negative regulator of RcsB-dependent stress response
MSQEVKENKEISNSALESPEALVEKLSSFEEYIEKNSKQLGIVVGIIALVISGFFGYRWYTTSQDEIAQKEMFSAVYYFEADSLDKALKGAYPSVKGLEYIAEEYSGTKSGKLAKFYIGAILLKKGKYEEAIENLKGYNTNDLLLLPRANCLIGDAYFELKDLDHALEYYKKAALHAPNKFFSPKYLMKAALVQELQKNYPDAINTYDQLIQKYYDSQEAVDAKKLKARLEQMTSGS